MNCVLAKRVANWISQTGGEQNKVSENSSYLVRFSRNNTNFLKKSSIYVGFFFFFCIWCSLCVMLLYCCMVHHMDRMTIRIIYTWRMSHISNLAWELWLLINNLGFPWWLATAHVMFLCVFSLLTHTSTFYLAYFFDCVLWICRIITLMVYVLCRIKASGQGTITREDTDPIPSIGPILAKNVASDIRENILDIRACNKWLEHNKKDQNWIWKIHLFL